MSVALGAVGAMLACAASWLSLFAVVGNVGLQRAVSIGPQTLLEAPIPLVLPLAATFAVAFGWKWWAARSTSLLAFVIPVIGWNLFAAFVLAPLAIGELTVEHAGVVLITTTVFGGQVIAAGLGAGLAPRPAARR